MSMRLLVALLALANLTLLGYILLEQSSGREPERLERQLDRDRIKILTPQQVAALGPSKAAALPNVCLEWGPFAESEREKVAAVFEPFQLGRLLTLRRVEVGTAHWVFVPPLPSRAAADRRVAELRGQGIGDLFVVESPENRNAISLGIFRTEEAARRHAEALRGRGIEGIQTGPRGQTVAQTLFVVRDPQPALVSRVREAQGEFAGVEVRTGPCAEGN
jgi:hypothetical protein